MLQSKVLLGALFGVIAITFVLYADSKNATIEDLEQQLSQKSYMHSLCAASNDNLVFAIERQNEKLQELELNLKELELKKAQVVTKWQVKEVKDMSCEEKLRELNALDTGFFGSRR